MRTLDLCKNLITEVTNQTLVGLDSLEQVDLSNNLIITIDCHAFWGLSSVKTIALNFNDIRDFPCYCFKNNAIKITEMDLMANEIENIHPSAIKCASSVEFLNFWAARLDTLDFISSLSNLTKLVLSLNFKTLAFDKLTFSASFALGHIEIVECRLQEFPVLSVSKNVTTLITLNNNRISCIDVPRITGLLALWKLELNNNDLLHFPSNSCPRSDPVVAVEANFTFPSMTHRRINYNRLEAFPVLPGLANQSLIELNHNNISRFPVQNLAMLTTASCIKLSHNSANSFPDFSLLANNQFAIIHLVLTESKVFLMNISRLWCTLRNWRWTTTILMLCRKLSFASFSLYTSHCITTCCRIWVLW